MERTWVANSTRGPVVRAIGIVGVGGEGVLVLVVASLSGGVGGVGLGEERVTVT